MNGTSKERIVCIVCRKEFRARRDAKTCSDDCRKKYQRQREDIDKSLVCALSDMMRIRRIMKFRPELRKLALVRIEQIKNDCDELLNLYDDERKIRNQMFSDYRSKRGIDDPKDLQESEFS